MKKEKRIVSVVDEETLNKAKRIAEKKGLSVSSLIKLILSKIIE